MNRIASLALAALLALGLPAFASDIATSDFSETAAGNNATPPNGFPEGQAPSTLNDSARELMAAVKRDWNRSRPTLTAGGTANALTLTYTEAPAALVRGMKFSFVAAAANTGAATLNVNGLGAKDIKRSGAAGLAALAGAEIQAGQVVEVAYDGTQFVITSPAANAVLATRTVSAGNGLTGGGDLSANRSFAVGAGTGITVGATTVSVDKATKANMEAESANKVVTSDVVVSNPGVAKAWVSFAGSSGTIQASYNVTGVTRNSTGDYTVSFSPSFSSAEYVMSGSAWRDTAGTGAGSANSITVGVARVAGAQAASSMRITATDTSGPLDPTRVMVVFFGDQ